MTPKGGGILKRHRHGDRRTVDLSVQFEEEDSSIVNMAQPSRQAQDDVSAASAMASNKKMVRRS